MSVGTHCILDIYDIQNTIKLEPDSIARIMDKIVDICSFTVVKKAEHRFTPYGLTIVYILSESHLIIHTFPERMICNIDIFCCKKNIQFNNVLEYVQSIFPGARFEQKIICR